MWRSVVWRGEVGDVTADGVFVRERERERERGLRERESKTCEGERYVQRERENKKVFFGILIRTFLNLE